MFERNSPYDNSFFGSQRNGALRSAAEVVPVIVELLAPRSVVDVGCGTGAWLSVFRTHGIEDVVGVDGGYVNPALLTIPADSFVAADLSKPIHLRRRFDLVMSLEVAEHLDPSAASEFVRSLTSLGDVVLFSAAIPGQCGVHHVNEQWPDYWRALFDRNNYELIDCLRDRIWDNPEIEFWYRQNMLLFVQRDYLASSPRLQVLSQSYSGRFVSVVHPEMFGSDGPRISLRQMIRQFPHAVRRAIDNRRSGGARQQA
ncbi:MAG TPA: methyltransferase domain-containing protein [Bryobacteraceae bacterium]|nr:methyltransferase domain-containing protein [Bryobacteraceae bacterium]